jgi:hypothetical protein
MARTPLLRVPLALGALALAGCDFGPIGPGQPEPMALVGADRASGIYLVDEVTGTETFVQTATVFDTLASPPVPIGPIASMSWIPAANAWWLATARTGGCPSCIFGFDVHAPSLAVVRLAIVEVDSIADFAVNPLNQRVYTLEKGGSGFVFRVDPRTGAFLEVYNRMADGPYGKGATFTDEGLLYVAGGSQLIRVRLNRLESTVVGTLTFAGFPTFANYSVTIGSLATRPSDGTVFALVEDGGGMAGTVTTTYLATLDLETAVVTNLGANANVLSALAFVPTRLVQ